MKISVDFKGSDEVMKHLTKLQERAPNALGKALYEEANDILRASLILVPVDTGVLKGSGLVENPQMHGSEVSVAIGYGGAASAYAEVQHEELSFKHTPPTQALYLSQPFNEAVKNGMDERIAATIKRELV